MHRHLPVGSNTAFANPSTQDLFLRKVSGEWDHGKLWLSAELANSWPGGLNEASHMLFGLHHTASPSHLVFKNLKNLPKLKNQKC